MTITAQDVKTTALTAPTVAFIITALRLFERARTHKFGADDAFALLSAIFLLIFVVGMFVHLDHPDLSRTTEVGLYYMLSLFFYTVLWTARLSILFSIVRITPGQRMRQMLYVLAVTFFICWAVLFAQDFWTCEAQATWKDLPTHQCVLGEKVAICQLITDIYADTFLIAFPLKLIWNVKISKGHRLRLYLIFSTSMITTIVSLVHAYYVLRVGGFPELIAAFVENAVSLIVCNSAVIITTAMRLLGVGGEDDSPSKTETYIVFAKKSSSKKSNFSTTLGSIELGTLGTTGTTTTKLDPTEEDIVGIGGGGEDLQLKKPVKWNSGEEIHVVVHEEVVRFDPQPDRKADMV